MILPLILSSSFVHEIEARKWVYHGLYLEQYPSIYYKVSDEFYLQDVALYQILLCCDRA